MIKLGLAVDEYKNRIKKNCFLEVLFEFIFKLLGRDIETSEAPQLSLGVHARGTAGPSSA
jgi:hypothetical protein